ncbi:IS607 family transposase [Streptomyces mirabilis]|nr:IS607 family transposase [Streptomyces sp. NBC_00271]
MGTHVKRAYRYRFYPTDAQAAELSRTFGCVRKVYNMALAAVVQGAIGLGLAVAEVVTEVGSGLNGNRRKLHRVLSDPAVAVIVVDHRDRLARFGVEHLESARSASGRRLVVLDPQETTSGLVRDITEVLTSMCARLYGQRAAKNRAARAIAEATAPAAETTG